MVTLDIDFLRPAPSPATNSRTATVAVWSLASLLLAWDIRLAVTLNQERDRLTTATLPARPLPEAKKPAGKTEPARGALDSQTILIIEQAVARARRADGSLRLESISLEAPVAKWRLLGRSETAKASAELAAALHSIAAGHQIEQAGMTQVDGGFRFEIALRKTEAIAR